MDAGMRNSVLLHESAISIYNCGLPLYTRVVGGCTFSCGAVLLHTLASSDAFSRFDRATCLGSVAIANISTQRYITFLSPAPQTF